MSRRNIVEFEQIAGPLLSDLGYQVNIDLTSDAIQTPWIDRMDQAISLLESFIPRGAPMVLIDQGKWGVESTIDGRLVRKIVEKNGRYWGSPVNDAQAADELERFRKAGMEYLVLAWPAFWWLENYRKFDAYLKNNYQCVTEDNNVMIFKLRRSANDSGVDV